MKLSILAHVSPRALSIAVAVAAASPAAAQAQEKPAELGSVVVTDTAIDEKEAETSYKVSRSISATRTDTPLIDVPQSVTVVPIKQILDQAAGSIAEATRYVPGVFVAQGEGNRETLIFRGNATTGDYFVDGIRDDIQTYRDFYNIERLEVFKGPNAMIFGRGGVGGLVNRVTKVADWTPHRAFRLEGGSFEHKRAQFDVGTPLSGAVAVRLTGVYQDSNSYRDGVNYNRWGFNPTITFSLDDKTTITAGYEHFQDDRVADRGVSAYLGRPLETPPERFFGDPQNSPTWTNTDAVTLYIEHRFSDTLSIRNRTRYADYSKLYRNTYPGAVNTKTSVNPEGLPRGSYAAGTIVEIQSYQATTQRQNLINQTDLNVAFATGAIEHTLLAGVELGRQVSDNFRVEGFFPTATNANGVSKIYATIASPRVRRPDILFRPTSTSNDNRGITTVAAGYIQDQIAFSPMVDVVLGLRYEHITTSVYDRRTVGFPATQRRDLEATDNLWSPRAGLIFKPVEQASIYGAFSRTYLPRGGDQLTGLSLSNENLAPERYDNYEIGAKWDIVPTFNVTAALFQLDRDNVLALSNPNDPRSPTVPIGRQRTKGFELSAQGEITDKLSVIGAYTYTDAKFLDSQSGTVQRGNLVPNVPRNAASLWTRFDPIEALGVAVGMIHQGKRFSATDNTVTMPAYTRFDGAIYFRVAPELDLQLNVENIFNKRYFLYAHSNTNHTPGSPTAFKLGLNARF
ncbi:TonB-dependent siderophore receptor [Sphingomonas sp. MMSM20]|uniref:TonB-dependent receptor n=1 Tax=Sphingomonas lycopersici TaxID=2951807 RepID=UPI00223783DE|nr:TonB-dependent siderophore receptor [Sphingomonas lycopersici]MCW6529953.1 TonB-dependent siderophore receptor [Sphingomonas lycopersici]